MACSWHIMRTVLSCSSIPAMTWSWVSRGGEFAAPTATHQTLQNRHHASCPSCPTDCWDASSGRTDLPAGKQVRRIAHPPNGGWIFAHGTPVWQRNYWDRVMRDDGEYERFAKYTRDNPANWQGDRFNR